MKMMSTAITVATGTERTNVRPGSAALSVDNSGPAGPSFAKSFSERVVGRAPLPEKSSADGATTTLQNSKTAVAVNAKGFSERVVGPILLLEKTSADEAMTTLQNSKTAVVAKSGIEVAGMSIGVEGKAVATLQISRRNELKSTVAEKIVQPQATAMAGSQEKTTSGQRSTTEEVESPALVAEESDDTSIASRIPYTSSIVRLPDEGLNPSFRSAEEERPLASSARDLLVKTETEIGGKTKDATSEKKMAKQQESAATIEAAQSSVGAAVKTSAIETPAAASSAEGAIPAVGPAVATGFLPWSEITNATEGFSKANSGVVKPSAGIGHATVDGLVRKDVALGPKPTAIDPETTVTTTADGQVASPKPAAGMEKMAAIAIPRGSDDENKAQGMPMAAAVAAHSIAGTSWVSGVAPTAVMSGATPGELTAAKFPVGEASPQSAGLPNGSNEQDVVGVAAASMDGAPRMLMATPTALEVGIQDGTHGWLKVRAEMVEGGGVVNASVSAASSAGQEMLHRELPALTVYLQEEKVSVNTVVVHAQSTAAAESRRSEGMDGAGGQTPQRNNEGEEEQQNIRKTNMSGADEAETYRSLHGVDQDGSIPLASYASGGGWLSVRA
jgi:hypothetical protein